MCFFLFACSRTPKGSAVSIAVHPRLRLCTVIEVYLLLSSQLVKGKSIPVVCIASPSLASHPSGHNNIVYVRTSFPAHEALRQLIDPFENLHLEIPLLHTTLAAFAAASTLKLIASLPTSVALHSIPILYILQSWCARAMSRCVTR